MLTNTRRKTTQPGTCGVGVPTVFMYEFSSSHILARLVDICPFRPKAHYIISFFLSLHCRLAQGGQNFLSQNFVWQGARCDLQVRISHSRSSSLLRQENVIVFVHLQKEAAKITSKHMLSIYRFAQTREKNCIIHLTKEAQEIELLHV